MTESSRCYLNAELPLWEKYDDASSPDFQYDRAGRLGGANAPNYDGAGGYGYKRVYRYDSRSNCERSPRSA